MAYQPFATASRKIPVSSPDNTGFGNQKQPLSGKISEPRAKGLPREARKRKLPRMKYLERLEQVLDARGITWKEIAKHLQIWPNKISKWKSGQGHPRFDQVVLICKIVDIPLDWLAEEDPEVPAPRSPEELLLLDLVTRGPEAIGIPNALRAILEYLTTHPELKGAGTAAAQKKTAAPPGLPLVGEIRKRGRGKPNKPPRKGGDSG